MPNREWLSLAEIAWLWSDETGESAEAIERDLEDWFEDLVARAPAPQPDAPGREGDTTNLLMGLLGGRHLQRETLAIYCAERGRDMPLFWFADESEDSDDSEDGDPESRPPADLFDPATEQTLAENDVEATPLPGAPGTPCGPAGMTKTWPDPVPLLQAMGETLVNVTARVLARVPPLAQFGGYSHPKATWLAGGLALGLLLLVVGTMMGQGGTGRSEAGREEVSTAVETSLRGELAVARRQIDKLGAALEASEQEVTRLGTDLLAARQAPGRAKGTPRDVAAAADSSRQKLILAVEIARTQASLRSRDLAAALHRLARLESEAKTAKAAAASLAGQLAEMRRLRPDAPNSTPADSDVARREQVLAAQTATVQAARFGRDLDAARRRISQLEADVAAARAQTGGLAAQLAEVRQAQAATLAGIQSEAGARERELAAALDRIAELEAAQHAPDAKAGRPAPSPVAAAPNDPETAVDGPAEQAVANRPTRPAPSAAAEPIDVDSLVADPARYDARHVVVTGSLLRLLQHYRLQSKSGLRTLVVDVAGLHRAEYDELQHAIAGAGPIGKVRARISGTVERGSADAFRLVASELKLVE